MRLEVPEHRMYPREEDMKALVAAKKMALLGTNRVAMGSMDIDLLLEAEDAQDTRPGPKVDRREFDRAWERLCREHKVGDASRGEVMKRLEIFAETGSLGYPRGGARGRVTVKQLLDGMGLLEVLPGRSINREVRSYTRNALKSMRVRGDLLRKGNGVTRGRGRQ
jgi:hypothetical protein